MAFEDIERLKEKISKDPNSKLFVPLAEEYKKAGMFDEAIDVLIKGLQRQPNYLSARVSLGKIYTERGMLNEAKNEFEKVISSIPENLYAHKKLAEIYKSLGEKDKAIKEFKAVLRLNPMDEWAVANLVEIEREEQTAEKQSAIDLETERTTEKIEVQEVEEEVEEPTQEVMQEVEDAEVIPEEMSEESLEELTDVFAVEEKAEELLQEASEEIAEMIEEEKDVSDIFKAEEEKVKDQEEAIEIEDEIEENVLDIPITEEDFEPTESYEAIEEVEEGYISHPTEIEATHDEEISFEGLEEEVELIPEEEAVISPPNFSDADQHILRGNYSEAMNVYRRLLANDPQNKQILQRVEELKALLRLLGKDKEELIIQLEKLLEGIKRRRDEFFRSS